MFSARHGRHVRLVVGWFITLRFSDDQHPATDPGVSLQVQSAVASTGYMGIPPSCPMLYNIYTGEQARHNGYFGPADQDEKGYCG